MSVSAVRCVYLQVCVNSFLLFTCRFFLFFPFTPHSYLFPILIVFLLISSLWDISEIFPFFSPLYQFSTYYLYKIQPSASFFPMLVVMEALRDKCLQGRCDSSMPYFSYKLRRKEFYPFLWNALESMNEKVLHSPSVTTVPNTNIFAISPS